MCYSTVYQGLPSNIRVTVRFTEQHTCYSNIHVLQYVLQVYRVTYVLQYVLQFTE